MAGNIPQIESPSVESHPLQLPRASPADAGAAIGHAVSQIGDEAAAIAVNQRHMAAAFDAQDAELKYGRAHDELKENYENQIRTLQSSDAASFQRDAIDLRAKFSQEQEELRQKYAKPLSDPLAAKAYAIRTRLQTQAAERQMLVFADQHIRAWRQADTDKSVAMDVERAGNVSGMADMEGDLQRLQMVRNSAHEKIALQYEDGQPRAVSEQKIREADRKMALNMLEGYNTKTDHTAALAFLGTTLPDGTHVTYDPKNPEDPYLLTSAEAQKYANHFAAMRGTKLANNFSAVNRNLPYGEFEAKAAEAFGINGPTPDGEGFEKAMGSYAKLKAEAHSEHLRQKEAIDLHNDEAVVTHGGYQEALDAGAIKPGGNLGHLLSIGGKVSAFNSKPVLDKVMGIFNDQDAKGFSSALPADTLQKVLDQSGLTSAVKQKIWTAYNKDAAGRSTEQRALGSERALTLVQDRVLAEIGYGRLSGRGISDIKTPWMQNLLFNAEIEFRKRVAAAPLKQGQKQLSSAETLQIASEVSKDIPSMKQQAKAGKLAEAKYTPPAGNDKPTPTQTKYASALIQALGVQAGPAPGGAAPDTAEPPVIDPADKTTYGALSDGAPYYVMQGTKKIGPFYKGKR